MANMPKIPKIPTAAAIGGIGALGLGVGGYVLVNHCLFNVEGGHRAVMYSRLSGMSPVVRGEGTHFKIPWVERPYIYNVRSTPRNIKSLTGSRDLQMVDINLRVIYRPMVEKLPDMYRTLGMDYDERVLPSIVNEVLKGVVAQYNAIELIVKREQVSAQVRQRLQERAKDFHVLLDDVSITHLAFSPQFTMAVESKQVAQQEAERAKYIVEKALEEKKSIIIAAEGEAEAGKLIANAVANNPGFIELREIQYALEVANTIANSQFKVYLSSDVLLMSGLARELNKGSVVNRKQGWLGWAGSFVGI